MIQEYDEHKNTCAIKNGYTIIRIHQPDVFNDKNDWEIKLRDAIKKYDEPVKICIGDIYTKLNEEKID
jgi:very-short-patch-repair endonuclease